MLTRFASPHPLLLHCCRLKPHVDPLTDNAPIGKTWRGNIGEFFTAKEWDAWFDSYGNMLLRYAALGEQTGVEMLSMNCELITANNQTARWRALVNKTRGVYSGLLTTAPNGHGHQNWVEWFDAVDVIGVDLYDHVAGDTVAEMAASLRPYVDQLESLHRKFARPVVLTEIGYCSGGCDRLHAASPADLANQADHYEAVFQATAGKPWFLGAFWWNWDSDPAFGAGDACLNPAWKPAEDVLRRYYRATRPKPAKPSQFTPACVGVGTCTC